MKGIYSETANNSKLNIVYSPILKIETASFTIHHEAL